MIVGSHSACGLVCAEPAEPLVLQAGGWNVDSTAYGPFMENLETKKSALKRVTTLRLAAR